MSLSINKITFTGNDDDRHVSATQVGVATGATVGGAKYSASALSKLNNASKAAKRPLLDGMAKGKDIVQLSENAAKNIKTAANTTKQVKSLWGKMFANAGKYKDAIINWAKKTATGKFATKVVNSKAFGKVSGFLGGAGAMFVFISGIGEMGKMFSKMSDN